MGLNDECPGGLFFYTTATPSTIRNHIIMVTGLWTVALFPCVPPPIFFVGGFPYLLLFVVGFLISCLARLAILVPHVKLPCMYMPLLSWAVGSIDVGIRQSWLEHLF